MTDLGTPNTHCGKHFKEAKMVVSVAQCENIALVTIDNPPVNAISLAVRQKLLSVINNTNSDDTVKAVILICAGRSFIAGADVYALKSKIRNF